MLLGVHPGKLLQISNQVSHRKLNVHDLLGFIQKLQTYPLCSLRIIAFPNDPLTYTFLVQ